MMNRETELPQSYARAASPFRAVPEWLWVPLVAGILILVCGVVGLAAGQLWLFPGLGPTAFLQAAAPRLPSARFYNVLVGHAAGIGAAAFAVWVFGLEQETAILVHQKLSWEQVGGSALALALLVYFQMLLQANHPPAAATALLLTLGQFKVDFHDISVILVGVLLVGVVGEFFRRARAA